MADTHYLISDASRKVDVESHVLRYWEEELEMNIPRNEMGHRYYTELHIRLLEASRATYMISQFHAMKGAWRLWKIRWGSGCSQ